MDDEFDSDDDIEFEFEPDSDNIESDSGNIEPEFKIINAVIFNRTITNVLSTSEDYVNTWVTQHIHYPNCGPTTTKYPPSIRNLVLGFDIQLVDPDHRYPPVATVQLCVHVEVLIYHMYDASTLPAALELFLTDHNNIFVGVNLERKLRLLRHETNHAGRVAYRNLRSVAARRLERPELLHADVGRLARDVLGREVVMLEEDPNWDRPELLRNQVINAGARAYVAYELGRALMHACFKGN